MQGLPQPGDGITMIMDQPRVITANPTLIWTPAAAGLSSAAATAVGPAPRPCVASLSMMLDRTTTATGPEAIGP